MKILAFITLLFISFSCAACEFETVDDAIVRSVVKPRGGYPISEQQCRLLSGNGLALSVAGAYGVMEGVSIGWAKITLMDFKTHATSTVYQVATNLNTRNASKDAAEKLLYDSITKALGEFDFEGAVVEINGYRTKMKPAR
ncbi:hypothetical protein [Duganella sp. Dugasp56]|uniref:hypothetical protein n=1 Tax=Duganella sp. Dugasp56 TaxID=3243046 RepID=UPI0039AF9668